ncbi:glycerol dehydrogenase, partial [Streptococcus suis]
EIICQATPRLLASVIEDGLATWVEARAILQINGTTMAGGGQTLAGIDIAQSCEQTVFVYGLQAMASCEAKFVSAALENI